MSRTRARVGVAPDQVVVNDRVNASALATKRGFQTRDAEEVQAINVTTEDLC